MSILVTRYSEPGLYYFQTTVHINCNCCDFTGCFKSSFRFFLRLNFTAYQNTVFKT